MDCLPLIEFTYNNSYQASIGMAPFEALYGRKCKTPICWYDDGEAVLLGPEMLQQINEQVKLIREKIKASQARQHNLVSSKLKKRLNDIINNILNSTNITFKPLYF